MCDSVQQRTWLVFPAGVDHPADRKRRGVLVGPCWWRAAIDEGARQLGLLRDECDCEPVDEVQPVVERRRRAA